MLGDKFAKKWLNLRNFGGQSSRKNDREKNSHFLGNFLGKFCSELMNIFN